jgi:hypothetical protein
MEEEELKVNLLPALTGKTGEISPEVVLLWDKCVLRPLSEGNLLGFKVGDFRVLSIFARCCLIPLVVKRQSWEIKCYNQTRARTRYLNLSLSSATTKRKFCTILIHPISHRFPQSPFHFPTRSWKAANHNNFSPNTHLRYISSAHISIGLVSIDFTSAYILFW